MQNPARPADLSALGVVVDDPEVAQARLDVSWRALLREREVRGLPEWIEAGLVAREDVIDVVRAATMRVLRNPEGFVSEQGGIDDYTEAVKRADATEDVYFTAAELRRLRPDELLSGGFAGSMKYR